MYRTFRTPLLWRELDRLQQDMNRLMSDFYPSRLQAAPGYPAVNVWINDDRQIVTVELPGFQPDDLDILVDGRDLTVSGSRQLADLPEGARYHRQERSMGKFTRKFTLPYSVKVDAVEAAFKNGVLYLSLPRSEADKPKKITVKS